MRQRSDDLAATIAAALALADAELNYVVAALLAEALDIVERNRTPR